MVCAAPTIWLFNDFDLKRGGDFDLTILVCNRLYFLLWLALSILFTRNYFFRINMGKFVDLLKCLGKWKPILVSCGHACIRAVY